MADRGDRIRNTTAGALVGTGGAYGVHVANQWQGRTKALKDTKGDLRYSTNVHRVNVNNVETQRRALLQDTGAYQVRRADLAQAQAIPSRLRNVEVPKAQRAHDAAQQSVEGQRQRFGNAVTHQNHSARGVRAAAEKVEGAKWARRRTGAKGVLAAGLVATGASVWGSDAWRSRKKGSLKPLQRRVSFRAPAPANDGLLARERKLAEAKRWEAPGAGRKKTQEHAMAGKRGPIPRESMAEAAGSMTEAARRRNGL
jgi:hypothetical protein